VISTKREIVIEEGDILKLIPLLFFAIRLSIFSLSALNITAEVEAEVEEESGSIAEVQVESQ
jgi:tagatose-1,6-bisphosphate aldolase non-catalytic subunit AgaZ/GatZ